MIERLELAQQFQLLWADSLFCASSCATIHDRFHLDLHLLAVSIVRNLCNLEYVCRHMYTGQVFRDPTSNLCSKLLSRKNATTGSVLPTFEEEEDSFRGI